MRPRDFWKGRKGTGPIIKKLVRMKMAPHNMTALAGFWSQTYPDIGADIMKPVSIMTNTRPVISGERLNSRRCGSKVA